jgi:acetyl-CoA C-acetyltransferase
MGSDGGAWHGPAHQPVQDGLRTAGHRRRPHRHAGRLLRERTWTASRCARSSARQSARAEGRFNKIGGAGQGRQRTDGAGSMTSTSAPTPRWKAMASSSPPSSRWARWASTPPRCANTPRSREINHVHHAGNSSGIVDGAALMLIGSKKIGKQARPQAARAHRADRSHRLGADDHADRHRPGVAQGAGQGRHGAKDIDLFEINEAFAAVVMHAARDLGIDMDRRSTSTAAPSRWAIRWAPPAASSSAPCSTSSSARTSRPGCASLCVGGGMGIATIIERVRTNEHS